MRRFQSWLLDRALPAPDRPQDHLAAAGSLVLYTEEGTYFGRSWAGNVQNISCRYGVSSCSSPPSLFGAARVHACVLAT